MTKLQKMQRILEIKDELFKLNQEDAVTLDAAKLVEEVTRLTLDVIEDVYDPLEIIGFDGLTDEQQTHILAVNKRQIECSGTDRKLGLKILKAWLDESGVTCVKLLNGEWYHYYSDRSWG